MHVRADCHQTVTKTFEFFDRRPFAVDICVRVAHRDADAGVSQEFFHRHNVNATVHELTRSWQLIASQIGPKDYLRAADGSGVGERDQRRVALGEVLVPLSVLARGHGPLACDTLPSKRRVFRGASMDAMLTITGIAEIVLNVRDLPKMREFYKKVLGFKLLSEACHETGPEPDAHGDPTIAFLTIKGVDTPLGRHGHPQLLALIDFQRHVFAKGRFDGHEPTRSTLNHLAFEIPPESYEAHKERLEAFGLRPRPVTFPAMTARALFFDDPEQNVLELICYAGSTANLAASTGHVMSED